MGIKIKGSAISQAEPDLQSMAKEVYGGQEPAGKNTAPQTARQKNEVEDFAADWNKRRMLAGLGKVDTALPDVDISPSKDRSFMEVADENKEESIRPSAYFDAAVGRYGKEKEWIKKVQADPDLSPEVKKDLTDKFNATVAANGERVEGYKMPDAAADWLERKKENKQIPIHNPSAMGGSISYIPIKENKQEDIDTINDYLQNSAEGQRYVKAEKDFIDNLIGRIDPLIEEGTKLRDEAAWKYLDSKPESANPSLGIPRKYYDVNYEKDVTLTNKALNVLKEAKKRVSAATEGGGFSKGLHMTQEDIAELATFSDYLNDYHLNEVIDKYVTDPSSLTPEENLAIQAKYVADQITAGVDPGSMYTIGQTTKQSMPFMRDFLLTNPVGRGASALVKGGAAALAKKAGVKSLPKILPKLGGAAVDMTIRPEVQTMLSPSSYAMAFEEMQGKATDKHKNGDITFDGRRSFGHGMASAFVENQSEVFGEVVLDKLMQKLRIPTPVLFKKNIGRQLSRATGIQGLPTEYLEEKESDFVNIIRGEQTLEGFFDPRQNLETFGAVAIMQIPFLSINATGYGIGKVKDAQAKRAVAQVYNTARSHLGGLFGQQTESMISYLNRVLDSGSEEEVKKTLQNIVSNQQLDDTEKRAVTEYAIAYSAYSGYIHSVQDEITTEKENAGREIDNRTNAETGTVIAVGSNFSDKPVNIVGGNLAFQEDGTVDVANSSETIYYLDEDGKRKMGTPDMFSSLVSSMPADEAKEEAINEVEETIISREEQEVETPIEMGMQVNTPEGTGVVSRFDTEGNAIVSFESGEDKAFGMGEIQAVGEPLNAGIADGSPDGEAAPNALQSEEVQSTDTQPIEGDPAGQIPAATTGQSPAGDMQAAPQTYPIDDDVTATQNEDGTFTLSKQYPKSGLESGQKYVDKLNADFADTGMAFELVALPKQTGNPFERPMWGVIARQAPNGEPVGEAQQPGGQSEEAEVDDKGIPFAKASDGSTVFGEIGEEQASAIGTGVPAPIKLSEGNVDFGKQHMEKRTSQIQNAGYGSIEDFVEDVARNYDEIREGNLYQDENGVEKETFLIIKKDKHGHTLFIELSPDGEYYDVNSGGIFNNSYVGKRDLLWNRRESDSDLSEENQGLSIPSTSTNVPSGEVGALSSNKPSEKETLRNASTEHSTPSAVTQDFPTTQLNAESGAVSALSQSSPLSENKNSEEKVDSQTSGDVSETRVAATPAPVKRPTAFQSRLDAVADMVTTIRQQILYGIAAGAFRFRWKDQGVSVGLGRELGFIGSEKERRSRISLLSNNGYTPTSLAHRLWEDNSTDLDDTDIRNEILDVLGTIISRRQALEELEGSLGMREEEFYRQEEEAAAYEEELRAQAEKIIWEVKDELAGEELLSLENEAFALGTTREQLNDAQTAFDLINLIEQLQDERQGQTSNERGNSGQNPTDNGEGQSNREGSQAVGERNGSGESKEIEGSDPGNKMRGRTAGSDADRTSGRSVPAYPIEDARVEEARWAAKQLDRQAEAEHPGGSVIDLIETVAKQQEIKDAETEVNTHPTEAQKEAGNYQKGHVSIQGLDISIENPRGAIRSGVDPDGKAWSQTMNNDYGYIRGTESKDGDAIDVFIGNNPSSEKVFVVDQVKADGAFDEHKVMIGFDSIEEARTAYLSNYEDGWQGLGNITETDIHTFKAWATKDGSRVKPFAEYKDLTGNPRENVYGSSNRIVSNERYEELKEQLRNKLNNLNTGFDPELFAIGTQMAAYHIEAGARKFVDFARRMMADVGENIIPYLKSFYEGARYLPGMEGFGTEIDTSETIRAFDIDSLKNNPIFEGNEPKTEGDGRQRPARDDREQRPVQNSPIQDGGISTGLAFGDVQRKAEESQRVDNNESRRRKSLGTGRAEERGKSGRSTGNQNDDSRSGLDAGESKPDIHLRKEGRQDHGRVVPGTVPGVDRQLNRNNNRQSLDENVVPQGTQAKINANIEAIKLAKRLFESGQKATPEQMKTLRKYTGWGGLSQVFKRDDKNYQTLKDLLTGDEYEAARASTTTAFYTPPEITAAVWEMAQKLGFKGGHILEPSAGIGNFFALMPETVSDVSSLKGIELDNVSGMILQLLYPDADIHISGFEEQRIANNSVDLVVSNVPFGNFKVHDANHKDISSKFDIHDFFIAKSIRALKPGGIAIFITTSGTLDKSSALRNWVVNNGNADFIDAVRLNSDTFKNDAGTEATADIIIIRKRDSKGRSPYAKNMQDVIAGREATFMQPVKNAWGSVVGEVEKTARMIYNKFFMDYPGRMAGEMKFGFEGGNALRPAEQRLAPARGIVQQAVIKQMTEDLPADIYHPAAVDRTPDVVANNGTKEGGLTIIDGKPYIIEFDEAVPVDWNGNKVAGHSKTEAAKDYLALKDALEKLVEAENNDTSDIESRRVALNQAYDAFTGKYGALTENRKIGFLEDDIDFITVSAIENKENGKIVKSDIFFKRVIDKQAAPKADHVTDAVRISMNQNGHVDIPYIANLLGKTEEETTEGILSERAGYMNPETGVIEPAAQYLSGNVRSKLAIAQAENADGEYNANIEELAKIVPPDIPLSVIKFTLGSTWIPDKVYNAFFEETFAVQANIRKTGNDKFTGNTRGHTPQNMREGIPGTPGSVLALDAMNSRATVISTTEWQNGKRVTLKDPIATAQAAIKQTELSEKFETWVKQKEEFTEELEGIYNNTFNAVVGQQTDASTFDRFPGAGGKVVPLMDEGDTKRFRAAKENTDADNKAVAEMAETYGLSHDRGTGIYSTPSAESAKKFLSDANGEVKLLREHQKEGVIRGLEGATLLAHEVGTGKTLTLITTAMEMRRLGLAKKPVIVVQRSTYKQFVKEIKNQYPNAKVLAPTDKDLTRKQRRQLFAKIAYNDWDIVVLYHDYLDSIPDDPQRVGSYIDEQIGEKMELLEELEEAKKEGGTNVGFMTRALRKQIESLQGKRDEALHGGDEEGIPAKKKRERSVKDIEKVRAHAATQAKRLLDRRTDATLTFEQLGIDALLIDEAHQYKRLGFSTSLDRVKGIDTAASKRSQSTRLKTSYILENHNGKNVVMATGTPISNTMAEMWTFMRYLLPKEELSRLQMKNFDAFVKNFGEITESAEFTTSGKFRVTNRFASFSNVPELLAAWKRIAHTVLTDGISELREGVGTPRVEGGKPTDILLDQTAPLKSVMKAVKEKLEEFEKMTGVEKKAHRAVPLVMFGLAKQAAIDVRLVDPTLPDDPHSKLNVSVEEILNDLKETAEYNGTVAVFCDSIQSRDKSFHIFRDIKKKLIASGIPSEQIAIIHDYKTDNAKGQLFVDINAGRVRVVMGSTDMLGVGVNIQQRLHTLIHLDAPIRPSDYQQRNGRIIRQNNLHLGMNKPVRILRIGVKKTLDVTGYQRLEIKKRFIDQIMKGDVSQRTIEEQDLEESDSNNFNQMMASLSGSEAALALSVEQNKLRKLQSAREGHNSAQIAMNARVQAGKRSIESGSRRIAALETYKESVRKAFPAGEVADVRIGNAKASSPEEIQALLHNQVSKRIEAEADTLRENYSRETSQLRIPMKINDVDFALTVDIRREHNLETRKTRITKEITFNTPTLVLSPTTGTPLISGTCGANINNLVPVLNEELSGRKTDATINRVTIETSKARNEVEAYGQQIGQPFPKEEELRKVEERVADLDMQMQKELRQIEEEERREMTEDISVDLGNAMEESPADDVRYRAGISDEMMDGFLDDEYAALPPETRKEIALRAVSEFGGDVRAAMDEYLDNTENSSIFASNENESQIPDGSSQEKFRSGNEVHIRIETEFADRLKRGIEAARRKSAENNGEMSLQTQSDVEKQIAFDFAKENGLWIDSIYSLGDPFKSGNENTVVVNEETGIVHKSNNLLNSNLLISNLLNQIKIHNELFPETKYHVVGFTGIDNGRNRVPHVEVVLSQDFIRHAEHATREEISAFMESIGFEKINGSKFSNGQYVVSDLHPRNVLKDERGTIYVVDDIVSRTEDVRGRAGNVKHEALDGVNDRFNEELRQQIEGTLPKGHVYTLGHPSDVLLASGIPDLPIEMVASRLSNKSMQENHPFDLSEVSNLPAAIQNPLAVFRSATHIGSFVIMTELEHDGKNFVVALQANRKKGNIEINDIRSIHYRSSNSHIANWIQEGLLDYADKKKMVEWLSKQRYHSAEVRKLFNHAANIVNSFENPTKGGEIIDSVTELASSLDTPVRMIRDVDEITDENAGRQKRKRQSKGWYDPQSGEVVIVLPNAESVEDAKATVLHEAVGHKGLRQLLGDRFDAMLDDVFKALPQDVRAEIALTAIREHRGDVRIATEEYLAGIAEKGVKKPGIVQRIASAVKIFLRSIGINVELTDGDVMYLLWQSKHNLERARTPMELIDTVARSEEMKDALYREKAELDDIERQYMGSLDKRIKLGKARRAFVDQYQPLLALEETVEKAAGRKLNTFERAYFNSQIVQSVDSRQMDDFELNQMHPIYRAASRIMEMGVTEDELTDYTKVKSGSYRNVKMRLQKGKEDGDFSGIYPIVERNGYSADDAGVTAFIHSFENGVDNGLTEGYWKAIKKATDRILEAGFDGGLISPEKYLELTSQDDYYVPLRGWAEGDMSDIYEYGGSGSARDAYQDIMKKAGGRTSEAADPLPFLKMLANSEIMRANKNKMKQSLKSLVANHKLPALYSIDKVYEVLQADASTGEDSWVEVAGKPSGDLFADGRARVSTAGHRFEKPITPYMLKENQVIVYELGEKYVMTFTNPAIAQSVNGDLNQSKMDKGFLSWAAGVNRFMSAAYTKWNPEFILYTNFMRDVIQANVVNLSKNGAAYLARFDRNLPKSFAAYMRMFRGKQFSTGNSAKDETDRYMNEFLENGGETGYSILKDYETTMKEIETELRGKKSFYEKINSSALGQYMENVGRMTEGATRFATYMTSRQTGGGIMESVLDAKNVTVNFNKRGSGETITIEDLALPVLSKLPVFKHLPIPSRYFQTAYIFFNASVQGVDVLWQTAKKHPAPMVMTASAFYALGMMMSLLGRMLMGDDDELGMSYYDEIPEWVRRSSLVIPTGGRNYVTIPLPHLLRAFYGIGEMTVSKITGNMPNQHIGVEMLSSLADDVYPIDLGSVKAGTLGGDGSVAPLIPTFAKPLWEAYAENKDWLGRPIGKETPFNGNMPGFRKANSHTGSFWIKFSEVLNAASGGDYSQQGGLDLNPSKLQHLVENYFGGLVKFSNKTSTALHAAYESMRTGETDFEMRDVPLLGKMVGRSSRNAGMQSYRSRFYDYLDALEKQEFVKRDYKRNDDYEKWKGFEVDGRLLDLKRANQRITKLRDIAKKKPERVDAISDDIDQLMMRAVQKYEKEPF